MIERAILERLEALVQLSIPPVEPGGKETNELRVLRLCDYNHTRDEISSELSISKNQVDVLLNSLRKAGRIRSLGKDGGTVYVRVRR